MKTVRIADIFKLDKSGDQIGVNGWVRTRRDAKGFSFLEINDGSTLANLQVIAAETLPLYENVIQKITTGSSLSIEGTVIESPGEGQRIELRAEKIEVLGLAPLEYPLQKKTLF
jgi:asparaginyl-tRNA synthetase